MMIVHCTVPLTWLYCIGRVGTSAGYRFVQELVCPQVGMSMIWLVRELAVRELSCPQFGCLWFGLSTSWAVSTFDDYCMLNSVRYVICITKHKDLNINLLLQPNANVRCISEGEKLLEVFALQMWKMIAKVLETSGLTIFYFSWMLYVRAYVHIRNQICCILTHSLLLEKLFWVQSAVVSCIFTSFWSCTFIA